MLTPRTTQWLATVGERWSRSFWLPSDYTEGQARFVIVEAWAPARSPAHTTDRPEASLHLRLTKVADGLVEVPALQADYLDQLADEPVAMAAE